MEYRQLGNSGLRISVMALGTMTFGGVGWARSAGTTGVEAARRQIGMCLDAGVNLIDTADVYSEGLSEEILGKALAGRRDEVLIATKVRFAMDQNSGPNDAGLSRHHILRSCEASLRRLGTDHIDLYQVHEWDGHTPLEETLSALDALVGSGKVCYVGASNYAAWQLVAALSVANRAGTARFVSHQIYYSLEAREAEYELIPAAIHQGLGILVWSPLAGGLLSGKYRREAAVPEGTRHFAGWNEPPIRDENKLYDIIDALVGIAAGRRVSPAQVALAYLIGRPGVTSVILGARTEEQLADNLAAATLTLTVEERTQLDEVSAIPLLYPYWHQARNASDRLSRADLSLLAGHLAR